MRKLGLSLLMAGVVLPAFAAHGDDCFWEAEDQSRLQGVELLDYSHAYQAMGRAGTLCIFLRGEDENSLACDDGTNGPFDGEVSASGARVVLFDGRRFTQRCPL